MTIHKVTVYAEERYIAVPSVGDAIHVFARSAYGQVDGVVVSPSTIGDDGGVMVCINADGACKRLYLYPEDFYCPPRRNTDVHQAR